MKAMDEVTRIGVILHPGKSGVEALLEGFALSLRDQNVAVGGLVQRLIPMNDGHCRMQLVDLGEGSHYGISQDLGPGSDSCRIDPRGLADASQVLRREIERSPDLLVINKFAGEESEGRGLLSEMFEAIAQGIPLLTAVSHRYKPKWDILMAGAGTFIEPSEAALWAWWRGLQ